MSRVAVIGVAAGIALALAAAPARAFPAGTQFDMDPVAMDGAGGISFTGTPRFAKHTCTVCHTDTPGRIGLRLESDDPALFTDGYTPKHQYHLRVVMTGEWAGQQYQALGDKCGFAQNPYVPCDQNGFAMEMDDALGRPMGKFVAVSGGNCVTGTPPTDADVYVAKDGTAVYHNGAHYGLVAWDLCWSAPEAGFGPITAYIAAVDGNGGDGTKDFPADTVGDDVAAGAVPLAENGATPPAPQTGGCAAGGDAGAGGLILVGAALALGGRRRRARRAGWARRLLAAALVVAALAPLVGCTHVRPTQRETLAKRKMLFGPDPAEDELDLHMQESREGSSGGYGSAGGGCGCN